MNDYNIMAGCLDWTEGILNARLKGTWTHVRTPDQLCVAVVDMGLPQFVFFPHWRWKVPKWLLDRTTCIGFHLGDLPHGRGGSPVQWRILEGKRTAGCRKRPAPIPQRSCRVLRRPCQKARRPRLGVFRAHHRRTNGFIRGSVSICRRKHGHAGQRQPFKTGS